MAELKKNQNGGARPGAGRKKGSTNKLRVTDFFNGEERDRLVEQAKLLTINAEGNPDKEMVKFLWEQLFGKATQRNELTGAEGEVLKIVFDNALKGE